MLNHYKVKLIKKVRKLIFIVKYFYDKENNK